jgi:Uri superfamily endonuclease
MSKSTSTAKKRKKGKSLKEPFSIVNKGVYIAGYTLDKTQKITIGKLGTFEFPRGYYYYVGRARNHLKQRIARQIDTWGDHRSKRWHIDYLRDYTVPWGAVALHSESDLECPVAKYLKRTPGIKELIPGFGSSDCSCNTHLFYSKRALDLMNIIQSKKNFAKEKVVVYLR